VTGERYADHSISFDDFMTLLFVTVTAYTLNLAVARWS